MKDKKKIILDLARKIIELWVKERKKFELKKIPGFFKEKTGAFVTIYTWPDKELRGCIGYPEPYFPLIKSISSAAIQACQDPRFEPLKQEELDKIVIEVSILTKPELIKVKKPEDYVKKIKLGEDGLIIKKGAYSGLLLPQVASEHGFDLHEFLIQTCLKAGLPPTAWMEKNTQVYKFQSEIFAEEKPCSKLPK